MRPPHHWLIFMRREAANERVSMRSSFGNVSGLSGWPPRAAEWPTGAAGPRARSDGAPRPVALCTAGRGGPVARPLALALSCWVSPSRPLELPSQGRPPASASAWSRSLNQGPFPRGAGFKFRSCDGPGVCAALGISSQPGAGAFLCLDIFRVPK